MSKKMLSKNLLLPYKPPNGKINKVKLPEFCEE